MLALELRRRLVRLGSDDLAGALSESRDPAWKARCRIGYATAVILPGAQTDPGAQAQAANRAAGPASRPKAITTMRRASRLYATSTSARGFLAAMSRRVLPAPDGARPSPPNHGTQRARTIGRTAIIASPRRLHVLAMVGLLSAKTSAPAIACKKARRSGHDTRGRRCWRSAGLPVLAGSPAS